ncbi:hypothetical protein Q1J52_04015 [Pseudomonas lijiangensis]|uniref:hypothetical protein n=1 Tax=Pseudomonas TaxID=286 RepID=UPI000BA341D3|nr:MULTISPECIES: hypothetical protein [Pseudomonas]GFM66095.1 hypothetical protein PSCICJ_22130 [Pseudomonas cichorii]
MNPKDFIIGIKASVVEDNIDLYKDLLSSTSIKDATDDYWKQSLTFFNSLTAEQQQALFAIIKQTIIDTTSNILGIIDGVSMLDGATDDFSLTYGKDKAPLSGDLQSLFLAETEKTS